MTMREREGWKRREREMTARKRDNMGEDAMVKIISGGTEKYFKFKMDSKV